MKTVLIRFLIFILPAVLLANSVDHSISGILRKSNSFADGEYPVWNDLYNGNINSEVVIYGSSRALVQIDPAMIGERLRETVYNLGVNGHSFNSQYFRHYLLLKYNIHPKLIIQTLDITSFDIKSDYYNPDQYLPYMLNNNEMREAVHNSFRPVDYRVPLIRYYGNKAALLEILRLLFHPSGNTILRVRGYQPKNLTWNDDLIKAQKRLGTYRVNADSSLVHLFDKYLYECKMNNIKVVFVNTPVFIEGQQFVENWADIMTIYYGFSKKYNIPFFDYSKDSISFNKAYFYNSGHLNKTGAELLTSKLIEDLSNSQFMIGTEQ